MAETPPNQCDASPLDQYNWPTNDAKARATFWINTVAATLRESSHATTPDSHRFPWPKLNQVFAQRLCPRRGANMPLAREPTTHKDPGQCKAALQSQHGAARASCRQNNIRPPLLHRLGKAFGDALVASPTGP